MIQGSDEWKQARLGKITASRVWAIMPGKKGAYLASRKDYLSELLIERLTGNPTESYQSADMRHGTEWEPIARAAYEANTGNTVEEVGFIEHPSQPMFGASPDGLVEEGGAIEIKCPKTATHLTTLMTGNIKREYMFQMQAVMMCTHGLWCDFVSYDPRMPESGSFFVHRVPYDAGIGMDIMQEVTKALGELEEMEENLRRRLG